MVDGRHHRFSPMFVNDPYRNDQFAQHATIYISRRTDASNHIEIPISILNFVTSCVQVSGNSKVNSMGGKSSGCRSYT